MGKRTRTQLLDDATVIVPHIAESIRSADGYRVTISRMADELGLSRRALKYNIEVWRDEQTQADLAANQDWQIVERWLAGLQTPKSKRIAYATLIREVIETADQYEVRSFTDICKALGLSRPAAEDWYEAFGGEDRPILDGRTDPERRLYSLASALGDHERIATFKSADAARVQRAKERLAPRVEQIEQMAA